MLANQRLRIVLNLSLPEAEALGRLAECEIRDLRGQALALLREGLIAHGELDNAQFRSANGFPYRAVPSEEAA